MPKILLQKLNNRTLSMQSAWFLTAMSPLKTSPLFLSSRSITTKKWQFSDSINGISGVYHYTIKADKEDNEQEKLEEAIHNTIVRHTDSLFFLTEKSKIWRRSDENPNNFLPLQEHELSNIGLMLDLIKKQWLMPHGGHTCMAITDHQGSILKDSQVSLRPSKERILPGKLALHPKLFPSTLPGYVSTAQNMSIGEEIRYLSSKMLADKQRETTADLTIIPIAQTRIQLDQVLENIKSAQAIKLYNLCSLVVKRNKIEEITDATIKKYVKELKNLAEDFPELQAMSNDLDVVLAALACTHAIAQVCFGHTHAIDKEIGPDQPTQTAVIYCTMALIGTDKFLDFASKINFRDTASNLTKSS